MRLLHISDLHFWHIPLNPLRLAGKRFFGVGNLILRRARLFRMETTPAILERVRTINPDHILITGDLTTTALEEEFRIAHRAISSLERDSYSLTMIPGNHDRYTRGATRERLFEKYFGQYSPSDGYPWLRWIEPETAILALDACHPTRISARGTIVDSQIQKAQGLLEYHISRIKRLLVLCHYPVALPTGIRESRGHGLRGRDQLRRFLARLNPHLYCHGHVHRPWCFTPEGLPTTLCLNPGAALKKNDELGEQASMLEISLEDNSVVVSRHILKGAVWSLSDHTRLAGFFNHGS